MPTPDITADNLNDVMAFDHVIQVHPDGTVTDAPATVHAPELHDGELHHHPDAPQWTLMDGYSGQHGYSGPLMHQSEYIGGGLARDILTTPGYYVALTNITSDDEDPTEWAVARAELPDRDPQRWDLHVTVPGDTDLRPLLREAGAALTTQLAAHHVQAEVVAFTPPGDAFDSWHSSLVEPGNPRSTTLDFTTNDSLAASIATLSDEDITRLVALLREHADRVSDRELITLLRDDLAEQFPDHTPVGVLLMPVAEDSVGSYLGSTGDVLFDDGTEDTVDFGDPIEEVLTTRWPNVGSQAAVAVDLRSEGTVSFAHADYDIYDWFNWPRPA